MSFSSQIWVQWRCAGILKSDTVEVFTPWKSANVNKSFFPAGEPVVKHLPGQHWTLLSLSQLSNRGARHCITICKIFYYSCEKCGKAREGVMHTATTHLPSRGKVLRRLQVEGNGKEASTVSVAGAQKARGHELEGKVEKEM